LNCLVQESFFLHAIESVAKADLGVFFAEGIAAAIDVKSDLASTSELERSLKQIQTVKKLKKKFEKGMFMFGNEHDQKNVRKNTLCYF